VFLVLSIARDQWRKAVPATTELPMMDVFGQALLDHFHGTRSEPLYQRDGSRKYKHRIEEFYFREFSTEPGADWIASHLTGPVLDVGAGAGRDSLYFQDICDTTALEISQPLVELLKARDIRNVRRGDMFSLVDLFQPNEFRSILINGTQIGLVKSRRGFLEFLGDLDRLTQPQATIVFDCYDPTSNEAEQMLGYRPDATPGLGFRVYHYEYQGNVGKTLLFRLFSIQQLGHIPDETTWVLDAIHRPHDTYPMQIALAKQS
jgi:SAM-dependent methyltransferase